MLRMGVRALLVVLMLSPIVASAEQGAPPTGLTGDPALDQWLRTTFGQPIDAATLSDPVWGTKTLAALTDREREGARLFMQRCNVCHGIGMNSMAAYGPLLSKNNVAGREEDVRKLIRDGTVRMPAFRHALRPAQIEAIVEYLKKVESYAPAY